MSSRDSPMWLLRCMAQFNSSQQGVIASGQDIKLHLMHRSYKHKHKCFQADGKDKISVLHTQIQKPKTRLNILNLM